MPQILHQEDSDAADGVPSSFFVRKSVKLITMTPLFLTLGSIGAKIRG